MHPFNNIMGTRTVTITDHCWQAIINPNALSNKSIKYWKNLSKKFETYGISYREHIAGKMNAGKEITEKLCREGERHFIILGGDGTCNEVINGICSADIDTKEVFAVPFPVGTGNDWLHTHHYPENYLDVVDYFLKGKFLSHDIGRVDITNNEKVVATRYFINIAGFCFDAAVIRETIKGKTLMFKSYTYLYQLLKVLLTYNAGRVKISSRSFEIDEKIFTIAVGICKYNGNGMKQVPMANPTDGYLDVVVIRKISLLKVISNVKRLFSGEHIRLKEVSTHKVTEVEIKSTPYCLGEVEGEMLISGDYKISIIPQALNILQITE